MSSTDDHKDKIASKYEKIVATGKSARITVANTLKFAINLEEECVLVVEKGKRGSYSSTITGMRSEDNTKISEELRDMLRSSTSSNDKLRKLLFAANSWLDEPSVWTFPETKTAAVE